MTLVISCEHGGYQIPPEYEALFDGKESLLTSHCGYDPGTEDLFDYLLPHAAYGIKNTFSRLLIEFNRSEWSHQLFSSITQNLSKGEKERLLHDHYRPYRNSLGKAIEEKLYRKEWVLHLSLHSFTPIMGSQVRNNDIGILYDPRKPNEKRWAKKFKHILEDNMPNYRVRMNYPYLGKADGLTSHFRKKYSDRYLGIELEINQKWALDNRFPDSMKNQIVSCISKALNDF